MEEQLNKRGLGLRNLNKRKQIEPSPILVSDTKVPLPPLDNSGYSFDTIIIKIPRDYWTSKKGKEFVPVPNVGKPENKRNEGEIPRNLSVGKYNADCWIWGNGYNWDLYITTSIPHLLYKDNYYVTPLQDIPIFFDVFHEMLYKYFLRDFNKHHFNNFQIVRLDPFKHFQTRLTWTDIHKVMPPVLHYLKRNDLYSNNLTYETGIYYDSESKCKNKNAKSPHGYLMYDKPLEILSATKKRKISDEVLNHITNLLDNNITEIRLEDRALSPRHIFKYMLKDPEKDIPKFMLNRIGRKKNEIATIGKFLRILGNSYTRESDKK